EDLATDRPAPDRDPQQVADGFAVAVRPRLRRPARLDPARRDRVVEAERAAGVGDGSGAAVARAVVPLHARAALLLGGERDSGAAIRMVAAGLGGPLDTTHDPFGRRP